MQISNRYSFIHYAVPKTASQSSWKTFRKYVDIVGVDEKDSLLYHHTTPSEDLPEFENSPDKVEVNQLSQPTPIET